MIRLSNKRRIKRVRKIGLIIAGCFPTGRVVQSNEVSLEHQLGSNVRMICRDEITKRLCDPIQQPNQSTIRIPCQPNSQCSELISDQQTAQPMMSDFVQFAASNENQCQIPDTIGLNVQLRTINQQQLQQDGFSVTSQVDCPSQFNSRPDVSRASHIEQRQTCAQGQVFVQVPTVAPNQTFVQGPTVPPNQTFVQGRTVAPSQTFVQGRTVAPSQTFVQGPTVAPNQTFVQGQIAAPGQTFVQGQIAAPGHTFVQGQIAALGQTFVHGQSCTRSPVTDDVFRQQILQALGQQPQQATAGTVYVTPGANLVTAEQANNSAAIQHNTPKYQVVSPIGQPIAIVDQGKQNLVQPEITVLVDNRSDTNSTSACSRGSVPVCQIMNAQEISPNCFLVTDTPTTYTLVNEVNSATSSKSSSKKTQHLNGSKKTISNTTDTSYHKHGCSSSTSDRRKHVKHVVLPKDKIVLVNERNASSLFENSTKSEKVKYSRDGSQRIKVKRRDIGLIQTEIKNLRKNRKVPSTYLLRRNKIVKEEQDDGSSCSTACSCVCSSTCGHTNRFSGSSVDSFSTDSVSYHSVCNR